MNFEYDLALNYIKWLAVLSRLSAFLIAMPLFTSHNVPMRYKAAFLAVVSFLITPAVPAEWFAHPLLSNPTVISLTLFMLSEVATGLVVSLIFFAVIEIFEFGGSSIDREIGFSMAQVMDPVSSVSTTLFSNLLMQLFIIVFLIFDGHHDVLRIAMSSFKTLPPGTLLVNEATVGGVNGLVARILVVGLQLALPVIAVNLMVNIAMGILARVGEDFPVLMLSFPLRFGLGFIILIAIVPVMVSFCREANEILLQWLAAMTGT